MRLALGVVLVCSLTGCINPERWAAHMEKRQVESCVYVTGFVLPFLYMRSVSATAGLPIETCHEQRP